MSCFNGFLYRSLSIILPIFFCCVGSTDEPKGDVTEVAPSVLRSVRLNNYHNWKFGAGEHIPGSSKFDSELRRLSIRDAVVLAEAWTFRNVTPQMIRKINPKAKVYCYYALFCKNFSDGDPERMLTPLSKAMIDANDWWLRDGDGNIVMENPSLGYIDVGKSGVKEAYLENLLARMKGRGYDGILFDAWYGSIINNWFPPSSGGWFNTHPVPKSYPTDKEWFEKAWKPFVTYVVNGARAAGYRIIGNNAGEYGTDSVWKAWQRKHLDGVVYEQGALDWNYSGGGWLPGKTIEDRINSIANDPLEVWVANSGLVKDVDDYQRKQDVCLAMYYIAVPSNQEKRSYSSQFDATAHWQPLWDFNIGTPAAPAKKQQGRYFWSREYSRGFVILNYEAEKEMVVDLPAKYRDINGKIYSGKVSVPAHSALILALES